MSSRSRIRCSWGGKNQEMSCSWRVSGTPKTTLRQRPASELSSDLPRIGVKHFAFQVDSILEAKEFVEARGFATGIGAPKRQDRRIVLLHQRSERPPCWNSSKIARAFDSSAHAAFGPQPLPVAVSKIEKP